MENTDLKVYRKACGSAQLGVCVLDVVYSQAPFFCVHIQLGQNIDQLQVHCCWMTVQMGLQYVLGFCSIAQAVM